MQWPIVGCKKVVVPRDGILPWHSGRCPYLATKTGNSGTSLNVAHVTQDQELAWLIAQILA